MKSALEFAMAKFGPYEVDLRSGELRKHGIRLKLGEQPLRILIRLLDQPGELVTREELRSLLWSDAVFVDFEHGLNSAVQRLRDTLSDTAEKAQWIETVPRRGYRFVGSVEWLKANNHPSRPPDISEKEPDVAPLLSVPAPTAKSRWWTSRRAALILAPVLCLVVYFVLHLWLARPSASSTSGRVMLAVLPFENLTGDPGQEYFSDGLTEEMIAQLGALSPEHLGVISRTTSMVYKHTTKSTRQIGDELGVDYVLESSLRRDSGRVRITAQLTRVRDQVHIWASNYDGEVLDSIGLQEQVARAVAGQIEVKLSPEYANRATRSHPDSAANEAYLRGRFFFNQFTPEGYYKAIEYFRQAVDRDPNFAEAYAGLSECYRFLVITDSISPFQGSPLVADFARRAVMLGDNLAESHNALAGSLMDRYDWTGTEQELKRAIALNPSYSSTHRIYAAMLGAELRHREAWEQINEAMRTDPLSLPNNAELVRTLYYARDYDGAIQQAQRAMQIDPGYYRTHFWMARVYGQKRMYPEAIAEAQAILKVNPESTLGWTELACGLAGAGREAEARKILARLYARKRSSFVPTYNLAVIHVALHEDDEALRLLQQSYDEHDWALLVLACEPRLDPLRRLPAFRELLAKVHLPS
jgi:TolB-like protein/DNA-binding winged helix-turn-helix (wHTH) protein